MEAARLLPDGGEALRKDLQFVDELFGELAPLDEPLPPAKAKKLFFQVHSELSGEADQATNGG
jgi:hypothetical protein